MKRLLLVVLVCALVGALFVLPETVRADSLAVTFEEDSYLYFQMDGNSTVANDPARSGYSLKCPNLSTACRIRIDFNNYVHVTHVEMNSYKTYPPPYNLGRGIWLYDVEGTRLSTTFGDVGTGDLQYDSASSSEWAVYPPSADVDVANVAYAVVTLSTDMGLDVYMDDIQITYDTAEATVTPTPTMTATPSYLSDWNKPLRAGEQRYDDSSFHPAYTVSASLVAQAYKPDTTIGALGNYNLNVGFSANSQSSVFAVHAGTIDAVDAILPCPPSVASPPGGCGLYVDSLSGNLPIFVDAAAAYVITEQLDDGRTLRYVVNTPVVQADDEVQAGCLLGSTLPLKGLASLDLFGGAAIVQGLQENQSFDLSPFLVNEPSGAACAATVRENSCPLVANATFDSSLGGWQPSQGYASVPYGPANGLVFPASVQQTIRLDSAAEYTISYLYSVTPGAPPQNIIVTLGTSTQTLALVDRRSNVSGTIPAAAYTADQNDDLYTLRVTAERGMADQTTLGFICVADSTAPPIADGEGCIVFDPMFSLGFNDSPWVDIVSSPMPTWTPGMVEMADGADINQAFLLNPKAGGAEQQYNLTVTYRRKGITEAGKYIGIDWESDMVNDGTFEAVDSQLWVTATDIISIETDPTTEELVLTANGSDANQVVQISKVCVTPVEGGVAPGYVPPPPFQGGCRYCIYSPTGDVATDLSEFQQWLACQFYQLWECQAKILLRYIWQTLVNILTLLGFFRLWLSATIIGTVNWGGANIVIFARWLSSEFNNLGIRIGNALTSTISVTNIISGGGATLGDIILALIQGLFNLGQQIINGIATPIIQLLQQIVTGLLDLAKLIILLVGTFFSVLTSGALGILANIFGFLLGMYQSILNGFATAASAVVLPEWIPNCADSSSGLFVVCAAIYGVEQGLNTGPMVLVVPVGIGLASLSLILWGVGKIREAIS